MGVVIFSSVQPHLNELGEYNDGYHARYNEEFTKKANQNTLVVRWAHYVYDHVGSSSRDLLKRE